MSINFTPRQFVNTAAGEKVTEYEAMSLINGINEALKNPDGYDANLIAEYQAVAGDDNKVTVAEAEKWLKDNGKTYEDVYNYNSQFIYNLFTNKDDENKTELNNVLYEYGGKEFENNKKLTNITTELFNYLKNNDFKASDIDTLIAECNELNGASEYDLTVAKNMLTNMFNAYAHKYGDDKSFSFGDLKVLLEEKEVKDSASALLDWEFEQQGSNGFENYKIKNELKNELVDYLFENNIKENDIDTLIAGFDASLKDKGITASTNDLTLAKTILTNLYNESSMVDGDNTSMSITDLINYSAEQRKQNDIPAVAAALNLVGGNEFENQNLSTLIAEEFYNYYTEHDSIDNVDDFITSLKNNLTDKGINISANDLATAKTVVTNFINYQCKTRNYIWGNDDLANSFYGQISSRTEMITHDKNAQIFKNVLSDQRIIGENILDDDKLAKFTAKLYNYNGNPITLDKIDKILPNLLVGLEFNENEKAIAKTILTNLVNIYSGKAGNADSFSHSDMMALISEQEAFGTFT